MVNNRWARLSQNEKAELLGIYTSMGYNDLASIIAHYNSCGGKLKADGGPVTNTAQYKSDAYLYNPPVNVGAPIEVPLRYKPLPDYGDYVPQRTTGMLEDIPIEMGLEVPQRGYGVLMPDAPSAMPTLDARQDAARRIMAVENSKNNVNSGYDAKTGRWYPHKSHEGGADTIAYGIKLSNGTPEAALALKQGYLTDEQAENAVDSLVQKYYDAAKRVYDGKYGAGEWDKLSDKSQSILVDYSYNPGLAKFPKLMEGFHSGNLDLIRQNYKRYSGGKELGRNKVLLEELDTLENEYPIFRAEGGDLLGNGGPGLNSGWNIGASIINKIKQGVGNIRDKYLSDYADNGYVYSYPSNPVELMKYAISPYAKTDEYSNMMLRNMPEEVTNARRALFARNFDIDMGDKEYSNAIIESRYKPTISSDENAKYYTIPINDANTRFQYLTHIVGSSNISPGEDENGKYISMYDIWDLAPFSGEGNDFKNSKPVEIYDRFYESEAPDIYNSYSTPGLDTHLPNNGMTAYSHGGKVHIKPENQGRSYGPGGAIGGNNPVVAAYRIAREKYLTDYANRGKMYGYHYPHSVSSLVENYILSPYNYRNTERDQEFRTAQRRALFSKYYRLKNTDYNPDEFIVESSYKPSKSKDPDAKYYTYKLDDEFDRSSSFLNNNGKIKFDSGEDEKGKYISIYDVWDLAPFGNRTGNQMGGTPIEMYDRFYESENPRVYYRLKDMAPENEHASGGKIHIKPENRGKFTALKKRTGHSASWFKEHGTPAQKKMATFALNARKWKHEDGGPLREFDNISDIF